MVKASAGPIIFLVFIVIPAVFAAASPLLAMTPNERIISSTDTLQ